MILNQKKSFLNFSKNERSIFRFFFIFYPLAIFLTAFLVMTSQFSLARVPKNFDPQSQSELLVKLRGKGKTYRVKSFAGITLTELQKFYADNPWVEYVEPNASYELAAIPNDPEYSKLWYLPQIDAPAAWELTTGSEDVIVAVLDTGIDLDHPDIKDNLWINGLEIAENGIDDDRNGYIDDVRGWNFVEGNNNPEPQLGIGATPTGVNHGTLVAGIIGSVGNNNFGGAGVAWKVRLMPLRVLDSKGSGNAATVEQAIDYAIANGAKILNLSFVGNERSITLDRAIERSFNSGALVISAAGNFSTNGGSGIDMDLNPMYPACSDGASGENLVIAVAALDTLDQKLAFSNYGRCVDLAAPGIGIYNTLFNEPGSAEYGSAFGGPWRGTSMAAPAVSGAAALLHSLDVSFTNREVRDLLLGNANPIDSVNPAFRGKLGRGRLDIGSSMAAANTTRSDRGMRLSVPTTEPIFVVAPSGKFAPEVRVIGRDGVTWRTFLAYAPAFKGGVSVTVGDTDGDGLEEIITGAGAGGGPHVRIFTSLGTPLSNFFAFETSYRGGIRVRALDINGDGIKEIAVASGKGRDSEVRVFSRDGSLLHRFFVFSPKFRNGFSLSSGDIDGNGNDEIIVAAGAGGGPHVQIYQGDGRLISEFFAYERGFTGGVEVAAPDIDGDGKAEIATAPAGKRVRHINIFNSFGAARGEFQVYADNPSMSVKLTGLTLAVFDFDHDQKDEIIVGNAPGGDPVIKVFTPLGLLFETVNAYGEDFRGGLNVAVLQK